jgi:2-dehydro-3-deoxygluconokinase
MQIASATVGVAGDTLNTAIYLKRSAPDLTVDYITRLGDDPFSTRILDFIASEDLGTGRIAIASGGLPGLYAITLGDDGERSFTYWRSASAARGLFGDGDFSSLDGYDVIYLSGISMAILPNDVRLALLDHLRGHPGKVCYDSNYRPRLWDSVENARGVTQAFWDFCDIPLPSVDDEMALFGATEDDIRKKCAAMPGLGALKRGKDGPMSIGEPVSQTYPPAESVVDTTAAGDSFNGGYLAARLMDKSQAEALMAGHSLAAKVVGHRGAIIPR